MLDNDPHLSDEELLLLADGELTSRQAMRAHGHLAACWECRTRMGELEGAIADFVHAHHASLDSRLPPSAGPRALLKARLAESAMISTRKRWHGFFEYFLSKRQRAYLCAVLTLAVLCAWTVSRRAHHKSEPMSDQFSSKALPNRTLTPGAVRPVRRADVCAVENNDPAWLISARVQQEALQEYGVAGSQVRQYQLDYLIPPGLGGTKDILNLWPEPYSSTVWNAHVKDALENRLRNLVCGGQLDLPVAQHDIATDWIGAYKKYFHRDRPLANKYNFDSDERRSG